MKHPERVEDYLDHIVLEDFENNPQVQDAVIRNIEIIGEAAGRIQLQAPEFVRAHPEIPWQQMRGMRNKVFMVTSMWSCPWCGQRLKTICLGLGNKFRVCFERSMACGSGVH